MGQRTQIFIEAEDLKGNTKNYLLHQQWGYGLGLVKRLSMLLERLSMLSTKETFDEPIDFNKFYPDFDCLGYEEKDLRERKLTEEEIQELLFRQDNNNGWLVIKLKATKYPYCYDKIKFGFYDWDEDYEYIEFFPMKKYLEKYEIENEVIEKTLAYIDLYIGEEEKDFDLFK